MQRLHFLWRVGTLQTNKSCSSGIRGAYTAVPILSASAF